jgi:hypothetical protein
VLQTSRRCRRCLCSRPGRLRRQGNDGSGGPSPGQTATVRGIVTWLTSSAARRTCGQHRRHRHLRSFSTAVVVMTRSSCPESRFRSTGNGTDEPASPCHRRKRQPVDPALATAQPANDGAGGGGLKGFSQSEPASVTDTQQLDCDMGRAGSGTNYRLTDASGFVISGR